MIGVVLHHDSQAVALPAPRNGAINIRLAELGGKDVAFIDSLQRMHARMVGWLPTKQIEANIIKGNVLIAEENTGGTPVPLGYCISSDRYLKREELGIVYQLNVLPDKQRGLIGATLIKAVFERAAYGCKLFCCWCAQDLEANHFWESLGFVPLAFRTGSRARIKKDGTVSKPERMHIFWQRRIREGDRETPYWFPSETSGGALKENRLVLPIPPGTHWSEAKPAVLPEVGGLGFDARALQPSASTKERTPRTRKAKAPAVNKNLISRGGLRFVPVPGASPRRMSARRARLNPRPSPRPSGGARSSATIRSTSPLPATCGTATWKRSTAPPTRCFPDRRRSMT